MVFCLVALLATTIVLAIPLHLILALFFGGSPPFDALEVYGEPVVTTGTSDGVRVTEVSYAAFAILLVSKTFLFVSATFVAVTAIWCLVDKRKRSLLLDR